jgi:endonuclease-8
VPEGDIVWYTARRLHEALAGRPLTRSDFRVPRYATVDLAGQTVTESVSRGKHLLIRTSGGLTVHTHLKMEGAWRIRPAGTRITESHKIRLLLANAEYQAVGYQLGVTEVFGTGREGQVVGHLGPDLLDPGWGDDLEGAAVANLKAPRNTGRPVGEALLDQRNLAGIGTWYLAEMLFLQGIGPGRPTGSVEDLRSLVHLGHRLLSANKARPSRTSTGDTARGRESWVYGRAGRPCRRCGTTIRRAEQGRPGQERLRFWCPRCQPDDQPG